MSDILVAVPVLRRPQMVVEVLRRFEGTQVLFLPDGDDVGTLQALEEHKADYSIAPASKSHGVPTYATKVNHAYRTTSAEFILYASDDVVPDPKWKSRALAYLDEDPLIGLLGTNDMNHPMVMEGKLATHGIVRRSYVEVYGSASHPDAGPIFCEGYRHWCVDVEASYAARSRGAYKYAHDVVIRHERSRHRDEVYALGASFARVDRALRTQRCPLWPNTPRSDRLPRFE